MLRTLGGKYIGKCRLRAHHHPLLPPLSNQRSYKLPPARLIYKRVLGDGLLLASILDFRPRLANRCRVFPVYALLRASILDFRARLANRCKVFPVYGHLRAVILDLRGSIWESLHGLPGNSLVAAAILDFRPRFANHCSTIVAAVWNGPPAATVAAAMSRVRF